MSTAAACNPAFEVRRKLNRAGFVVAIVACTYGLFMLSRLANQGWNPAAFVCASREFCDPAATPAGLTVYREGYDGQFYYRLALAPFSNSPRVHGIRFDGGAYRQQRIAYPLAAWLLSVGRPEWAPLALLGVNFLALLALAGLAGSIAQALGRHAGWGLLVALYPGFLLSLSRDTPEIVEGAGLLLAILALLRERWVLLATGLSFAVLAKETALGAALVLAGWGAWRSLAQQNPGAGVRARRSAALLAGLAPVLVYAGWQIVLRLRWGVWPLAQGSGNIGMPFAALLEFAQNAWSWNSPQAVGWRFGLLYLGVYAVLVVISLRRVRGIAPIGWAWLAYTALAVCLSGMVWCEEWAFLRALTEWYIFGVLVLIAAGGWAMRSGALATVLVWLPLARVARHG